MNHKKTCVWAFALFFVLLFVAQAQAFTLRTGAFDFNTDAGIPSTVTFDGHTYTASNTVDIPNVRHSVTLPITHSSPGYITDTDDTFYDDKLTLCTGQPLCQVSSYIPPGGLFNTTCQFESTYQDYSCIVTNRGLDEGFFYKPSEHRVTQANYLVRTNESQTNPPPVIAAIVTPLSGAAPLAVTYTVSITDNGQVQYAYIEFGDGITQAIQNNANLIHVYQYGGIYNASIVAFDDRGLSSVRNYTITATGIPEPKYNGTVSFNLNIRTLDYNNLNVLSPSTVNVKNLTSNLTKTASPTAVYSVLSNQVMRITNSFPSYITDTDDLYLDYLLPTCSANICNLTSLDYFGDIYYTNCVLNTTSNQYLCTVTNRGLESDFFLNRGTNTVTYLNLLVGTGQGQPPSLTASVTPQSGTTPLTPTFTHQATDPDGQITSVMWFFGDGQAGYYNSTATFNHTYNLPGLYEAIVTAFDSQGLTTTRSFNITINGNPVNTPPTIVSASVVPSNGTVPLTSTFTANVTDDLGVLSTIWLFGDGSQASVGPLSQITHTYTTIGNFVATLVATDIQGAQTTRSFNITVRNISINQPPVITASVNPQAGQAPLTSTFVNNVTDDVAVASVTWLFGDGQSQTVPANSQLTHIYQTNGTYTAQIIAIDNQGATSTRNFTITVTSPTNQPPVIIANVTPTNGTAPLTSTFTNNVTDDQALSVVTWVFGDGFSQNVLSNSQFVHTYTTNGTYVAEIIAIDNQGATTTRNFTITVGTGGGNQTNQPPVIIASVTPTNGSAPLTSNFTNNVTDDYQVVSVSWLFGDGQSQNVPANSQITHTYTSNGTYYSQIIAIDSFGAMSTRNFTITVGSNGGNQTNQPPVIAAFVIPQTGFMPLSSTFTATVTDDYGVASVVWVFGDGQTQSVGSISQISHVYQTNGTYFAQIIAVDIFGATSSRNFTITVNPPGNQTNQPPVITAAVAPLNGSAPLTSLFTNNVTDDFGLASVSWIFGDGQSQNVASNSQIAHTYTNAGTYFAQIIAVDIYGATASRNFTITVTSGGNQTNQAPVIIANVTPTTGNASLTSTFTNNVTDDGSLSQILWVFGDGQSQNVPAISQITHIYTNPGVYLAAIIATDNLGLSSSRNFTITVNGGGNQTNPAPLVNASILPLTGNAPLTSIFSVNATDDGSISSVVWLFGDGQSQVVTQNSRTYHTYTTQGQYIATVVVTDNLGASTIRTFNIIVNSANPLNTAPNLFATVTPRRGSAPLNTTFFVNATDPDGLAAVAWFFGDGSSELVAPLSVITHVYTTIGTYIAQLVAIDSWGLASFMNFQVDVVAPGFNNTEFMGPNVIASVNPVSGSAPLTSTFTSNVTPNNASIYSVIWIFGDEQVQGVANVDQITHVYARPGTYTAQIVATDTQNKTTVKSFVISVGQPGSNQDDTQDNRARLLITHIAIPNEYDVKPGEDLEVYVTLQNNGETKLEKMTLSLVVPEMGIFAREGNINLARNGKQVTIPLTLEIPQDAEAGEYTLRFTVGNEEIRRIVHRDMAITVKGE